MTDITASLTQLLPKASSEVFDPAVFSETGVFVIRNAIASPTVAAWQAEWRGFYERSLAAGRNVNRANPVALTEALPEGLAGMYRDPALLHVVRQVFGPDVALYNHRFVIKDQYSRDKVFLHQDSCYHLGHMKKCSLFVPLSKVDAENGGLTFHVGSHKLGVLGDAGEINADSFDIKWPTITPALEPGDFVIMNSATWHHSGPNVSGVDRIMADTIVQPADDPTGKELLCGEWRTAVRYSPVDHTRYFVNSRILKLKRYEKELAQRAG